MHAITIVTQNNILAFSSIYESFKNCYLRSELPDRILMKHFWLQKLMLKLRSKGNRFFLSYISEDIRLISTCTLPCDLILYCGKNYENVFGNSLLTLESYKHFVLNCAFKVFDLRQDVVWQEGIFLFFNNQFAFNFHETTAYTYTVAIKFDHLL